MHHTTTTSRKMKGGRGERHADSRWSPNDRDNARQEHEGATCTRSIALTRTPTAVPSRVRSVLRPPLHPHPHPHPHPHGYSRKIDIHPVIHDLPSFPPFRSPSSLSLCLTVLSFLYTHTHLALQLFHSCWSSSSFPVRMCCFIPPELSASLTASPFPSSPLLCTLQFSRHLVERPPAPLCCAYAPEEKEGVGVVRLRWWW